MSPCQNKKCQFETIHFQHALTTGLSCAPHKQRENSLSGVHSHIHTHIVHLFAHTQIHAQCLIWESINWGTYFTWLLPPFQIRGDLAIRKGFAYNIDWLLWAYPKQWA